MRKQKSSILTFVIVLLIALGIRSQVAVVKVHGSSMAPTYNNGDIVIIKRNQDYKRGDLVVFEAPKSWMTNENGESLFLKRIAAVGGDSLDSSSDGLLVNGQLVRKHTGECSLSDSSEVLLPYRKLLVLGDNVMSSNDSYSQMCEGNEEILIDENSIIETGTELFRIGG